MEPPTAEERSQRAEQQRQRRLAKRSCGSCGEPADTMLPWGNQQVPICSPCQRKLETPAPVAVQCAFEEVHPRELRPQATPMPILVEARLLPAPEPVAEQRQPSLVGRLARAVGRLFRPRNGHRTQPAITGESD